MASKANLKTCTWKGDGNLKGVRRRTRVKHCVVKRVRGRQKTVSCHASPARARSVAKKHKGRVVKRKK